MPEEDVSKTSFASRVGGWVGVGASILTIALTVQNAQTKNRIDANEEAIKARVADLQSRAENVEESKERVARYTWVRGLFADLKSKDPQQRTLTVALIRMALTPDEANNLFAGLTHSSDSDLREAGQKGLSNLESETTTSLISRINGPQSDDRKAALYKLEKDFAASPATITEVLRMFDDSNSPGLSGPGLINAFYYLAKTDNSIWTDEQVDLAKKAIAKASQRATGQQAQAKIRNLQSFLEQVHPDFKQ